MSYHVDPIAVVIATSKGRSELLRNRSLKSVYLQEYVNPIEVVVIDDNPVPEGRERSEEFPKITDAIKTLRENILKKNYYRFIDKEKNCSFDDYFKTTLLKNTRTHGHSGTGAWNTAIFYLANKYEDMRLFVAILDDDDEYMNGYLKECASIIEDKGEGLAAIFPYLRWHGAGKGMVLEFTNADLTPRQFFIGDPGIQGSNMCIRLDLLVNIGGFDENLHSATDRDIMIRLLNYLANSEEKLEIHIIPEVRVLHYADQPDRVTNNRRLKKLGLDTFYSKWKDMFSQEDFVKSLERARRLFGYEYED